VPLALNQLGDDADQERVLGHPEAGGDRGASAGPGIGGVVDRAANDPQLLGGQSLGKQHVANPLRDGDHTVEEPVLERDQPARLGVVDPAGMDDRHTAQARSDAAHDVGTDAAVQMHQVRSARTDQASQTDDHRQVQIAPHRQAIDPRNGRGGLRQGTSGGAGEQIFMTACGKPAQQVQDLIGPAVEVTPALDMEDPHGATPSAPRAASRISSIVIRRIQVKAPSQVGRRLQGEQSSL
jgi:hypothetical protein